MRRKKFTFGRAVVIAVMVAFTVFFLLPYFWMIINSFKSNKDILSNPKAFFPEVWTLESYKTVIQEAPFFKWLFNSCFVTVVDTAIIVFDSALIGYVFSQYKFKGKNFLFIIVLITMMIPAQTTMIPMFLLLDRMGLYDNILALILPTLVSGYGIFLCKQYCDEIPRELMESAKIDGAKDIKIFWHIVLPQIRPAMGALTIFTFLAIWNEYLRPLIMISKVENMTLPVALTFFSGAHMTNLGATLAAAALSMIPVTVVFLAFQKHFIKGIAMTGMK